MAYSYIVLPWKRVEPVFDRRFTLSVLAALEANFVARRTPADVLRLVDGTVAYRMGQQYLDKYPFDAQGSFINLFSFGVHRFVDVDPSLAVKPEKSREDWLPVGNA